MTHIKEKIGKTENGMKKFGIEVKKIKKNQ
jgi:hypothetical protein